jgi:hypothetical protein
MTHRRTPALVCKRLDILALNLCTAVVVSAMERERREETQSDAAAGGPAGGQLSWQRGARDLIVSARPGL